VRRLSFSSCACHSLVPARRIYRDQVSLDEPKAPGVAVHVARAAFLHSCRRFFRFFMFYVGSPCSPAQRALFVRRFTPSYAQDGQQHKLDLSSLLHSPSTVRESSARRPLPSSAQDGLSCPPGCPRRAPAVILHSSMRLPSCGPACPSNPTELCSRRPSVSIRAHPHSPPRVILHSSMRLPSCGPACPSNPTELCSRRPSVSIRAYPHSPPRVIFGSSVFLLSSGTACPSNPTNEELCSSRRPFVSARE